MSKDAATPPGAAEGKTPAAPIMKMSRLEMIESIGRTRVETFNREQQEAGSDEVIPITPELRGDEDEHVDGEGDEAAAEAERARLKAEAAAAAAGKKDKSELERQLAADDRVTVIDDPAKYQVKVKVDGVEQTMSLADVVRINQKESAADRRLEQASTMLKAAEAREAAAQAALAAADDANKAKAEREAKAAADAKAAAEVDLKAKLKDYNDLLYAGKTEEAADAMLKIMEAREGRSNATRDAPVVIDVQKLKEQVKGELRTESALETFAGAYPEIIANPDLAKIADRHFEAAKKAGKTDAEAFTAAGEATRGYVRDLAKTLGMAEVKPKTAGGRESLEKRKETIDEPETASMGTSLKDTTPQESNPRSVIAEMAASRPGAAAHAAAAKRQAGG
jgi:hypothetical protein